MGYSRSILMQENLSVFIDWINFNVSIDFMNIKLTLSPVKAYRASKPPTNLILVSNTDNSDDWNKTHRIILNHAKSVNKLQDNC